MTTIDDDATMREEHFRDVALKQRKQEGPPATGRCLYCNAEVTENRRWCDEWCREDCVFGQEARRRHKGRL